MIISWPQVWCWIIKTQLQFNQSLWGRASCVLQQAGEVKSGLISNAVGKDQFSLISLFYAPLCPPFFCQKGQTWWVYVGGPHLIIAEAWAMVRWDSHPEGLADHPHYSHFRSSCLATLGLFTGHSTLGLWPIHYLQYCCFHSDNNITICYCNSWPISNVFIKL